MKILPIIAPGLLTALLSVAYISNADDSVTIDGVIVGAASSGGSSGTPAASNVTYSATLPYTGTNVQQAIDDLASADATPYAITAASGTATVDRANGWLQSLDMSGDLVLNITAGSASYLSQVNLTVDASTHTLSYSVNATNIVTGLSDITATNVTTFLLYSPMFETTWEASEL